MTPKATADHRADSVNLITASTHPHDVLIKHGKVNMKNKEKKQSNEDIWMVASDIAKQSRDYLRWHAGKPCNNFNLTQYRKALAEFVSFMESYEQQTEQA